MIVSDNTIKAEGLGDFFKTPGKKEPNASNKMAKNAMKKRERALKKGANVGTAFASRSHEAALSTLL